MDKLARRGNSGPLGALVKKQSTTLSVDDRARLDALRNRGTETTVKQLEKMQNGQLDIEIAPDFSASTSVLHTALIELAGNLQGQIATAYPAARISYGIFGGGNALAHSGSSRILQREHQATDGWESRFSTYAKEYGMRPRPGRQEVMISFHDARPAQDGDLEKAIQSINERGTIVVIGYFPSDGSENGDKAILQDLADGTAGGFERAIFLDLSGIQQGDPIVMEKLLGDLIDAVAKAQNESMKLAGNDMQVASVLAVTKLKAITDNVVGGARTLSSTRRPRLLLNGKIE